MSTSPSENPLSRAVRQTLGGADADLSSEPTYPEANQPFPTFAYPEDGLLRLNQIIGDPKADPPIPPIIPLKKSAWWKGIKELRFPAPVYLSGGRAAYWRVRDIRAVVESAQENSSRAQALTERIKRGRKRKQQNPGRDGQ